MIEVQNLTKTFNGKTVLNGISFEVKEGEIFGYLGPNGAGKTTTMRIMLGLLKPTSGNVLVQGQNLGENEELRNKVGVLLENNGLYEGLSAYEKSRSFTVEHLRRRFSKPIVEITFTVEVEEIKKTSKSLEDVYLDIIQRGREQAE
jgi:ABC-2 type transport system ATP-binding protein